MSAEGRSPAPASAAGGAYREDAPLWHGKELYAPRRLVDMLAPITLEADRVSLANLPA